MKKSYTLFTFIGLMALSNAILGQEVLKPFWVKQDSSANGQSEAWGIDIDKDGNVYWAVSNDHLGAGLDVYAYKYDKEGNALWASPFVYGGPGTQHAYIANAEDTALYIGGRSCTGLVTSCDMMLLKVDKTTGQLIWDKTQNFAANGYDEVDGLEIRPDGIYCGGWSQQLKSNIYFSDIGFWKLDFNGNTEWTHFLGDTQTAEHQDGHFVIDDNYIYAAGLWGGKGIANLYNGHAFLGKFNRTNGTLVDSTYFGYQSNAFNDIENALGMTSDGDYLYITGYTTPKSANDWQIFVAKFDKNLNQIWYTDWGGTGTETARAIKVLGDRVYVAGLTESASLMTGGVSDVLVLTLDTAGNVIRYGTYGGPAKEACQDLEVGTVKAAWGPADALYITGTSEKGSKKTSFLIANPLNTSSVSRLNPLLNWKVYPNPSTGNIFVSLDKHNPKKTQVRLFNLQGQLVFSQTLQAGETHFDLNVKKKGTYFLELEQNGIRQSKQVQIN